MAFKRKETIIEAIDLNTITPEDAESRIIAGVKKYATNEPNWSKADANTPYLGHIIGMGIESANLADITMSIERQFLTKKTRRVPIDGTNDFRLEDGELGKLRILDGQDATAATPGLSVKMLMDLGHMPKNESYLSKVVGFAYISSVGEGYRLNESIKKLMNRIDKLADSEKAEAIQNLKTMISQAKTYLSDISDPKRFADSKRKAYEADKAAHDNLTQELSLLQDKIKGLSSSNDHEKVSALNAELAELKTRLKMSSDKLRVSSEIASCAARRSPIEEAKVLEITSLISSTVSQAEKIS